MTYSEFQKKQDKLLKEYHKLSIEIIKLREEFKRECTHKYERNYGPYESGYSCKWCGAKRYEPINSSAWLPR